MPHWPKILIDSFDVILVSWLFFSFASKPASAAAGLADLERRSILSDWREFGLLLAISGIIYILRSLSTRKSTSKQGFVWAWKKLERLRVLSSQNEKNQIKFRRYTSPIHLVVAVCIHYFFENLYFMVVVVLQLRCDCSPTGKHSVRLFRLQFPVALLTVSLNYRRILDSLLRLELS